MSLKNGLKSTRQILVLIKIVAQSKNSKPLLLKSKICFLRNELLNSFVSNYHVMYANAAYQSQKSFSHFYFQSREFSALNPELLEKFENYPIKCYYYQ